MKGANNMAVINGTVYWNKTVVPERFMGNQSESLKWSIDIGNLEDKAVKVLQALGLEHKVKNKAEGTGTKGADPSDVRGDFVTFSTKVEREDGTPNKAPRFIDADKNELHPDSNGWLGNGSQVNVAFDAWPSKHGGKNMTMKTIQVIERKEFTPAADDELDVVPGGFVNDDEIPFPSN